MLQCPWARSKLFPIFVCIGFITVESSSVSSVFKHLGYINNNAFLQMLVEHLFEWKPWMKYRQVIPSDPALNVNFPIQKGSTQVWVICLWFFKATWLWRFIGLLVLLLFQSDDHGAVAENIDSTWEAQLRLGQVSNRYPDWNLDICKSKKLSLSTSKARLHRVKFKPAVMKHCRREWMNWWKVWLKRGLYQLLFWKLFRKKK